MNLKNQRRLAAQVLGVGENRVWLDPEKAELIESAITKEDIRRLVKSGAIAAKSRLGVSRARARLREEKRKKGRRRGPGSREGAAGARLPRKRRWISTIRALRARLKALREERRITDENYWKLYRMAKGGAFKSISSMEQYIRSAGLLRKKVR